MILEDGLDRLLPSFNWRLSHVSLSVCLLIMLQKAEFDFDIRSMDWEEYLMNFIYGMKRFILREVDMPHPFNDRNLPLYLSREFGGDLWCVLRV